MNLTDQQKLEILCAYLPHGVEVECNEGIIIEFSKINNSVPLLACNYDVQPILRHPDDMTDDELEKLRSIIKVPNIEYSKGWAILGGSIILSLNESQQALRYLHSRHIDTFGAIEAGFAIRKETN